MRSLLGSCFFATIVVACGGSVGTSSNPSGSSPSESAGPNGSEDGSPTTPPGTLGVEGSFDVTFTVVHAAGGEIPSHAPAPPSRTTAFRLDLRRDASKKLVGAMTARWGLVSALEVTEKPDALELAGSTSLNEPVSAVSGIADTWKTWRLPRNADGSLKGTFEASGDESFGEGDVMYQSTIGGSGTFAKDKTNPETRVRAYSRLAPDGKILPWDPIEVDLAEPIDRAAALSAAQVVDGKGATLAIAWGEPGAHVTDWAGVSGISGHATTWPSSTTWSGNVGAVTDRVGLGSAPSSSPLAFVTLGPKAQQIGFDDDVVLSTMWGTATLLGGGFAGTNDPHCESGGCLRIDGPPINSCDPSKRTGMAARLARGATGKVAVRYRVLVHPTTNVGGSPPLVPSLTTLQVATEGGGVKEDVLTVGALEKLATPIDQFEWATPWSTRELDAPTGAGDLGIAIGVAGSPYCGGPPFPEADITVLIENVESR